jgi:hypothetical protein
MAPLKKKEKKGIKQAVGLDTILADMILSIHSLKPLLGG